MDVLEKLCAGYGEIASGGVRGGTQANLFEGGNERLNEPFPKLDALLWAVLAVRAGVGVLALAGVLNAQEAAPTHFEVASVKVSTAGRPGRGAWGGPGTSSPGQFTAVGASLKDLLFRSAFNLSEFQYSALPWMDKQLYDVAAKVPPAITREQFRVLLQDLLIDRFQIKLHHMQQETTIYDLVIAKGGLKMKASPFDDNTPPPAARVALKADAEGFPVIPEGAGLFPVFRTHVNGQTVMVTNHASIAQLIADLAGNLKVSIGDKTGLHGNFAYRLHFQPAEPLPSESATMDPAPSLFEALQNQLGLKLDARKGLIDVLVIDKAEKIPIEN